VTGRSSVSGSAADDPSLAFVWPDVLDRLRAQLANKLKSWGGGRTLVFSMLTDAFSPVTLAAGTTRAALDLVMERTSFRVRVLTKSAVVGSDHWRDYFLSHPGRFVVGLSTGTLDDGWARNVEKGTSSPSARLRALRRLQNDGVPTFSMMCPVFPDAAHGDALDRLLGVARPHVVEHVWAEPYNDRENWRAVRDGYAPGSSGYEWLTRVYERGERGAWSAYATDLYVRLRDRARRDGWLHKLRYLLYEGDIAEGDAKAFRGLDGVLLQSKPAADGRSQNPHCGCKLHHSREERQKRHEAPFVREPIVSDSAAARVELRELARNILFDYEDGEAVPRDKTVRLAELCVALKVGEEPAAPSVPIEPGPAPA
jgi:DNA repair photolyase